MRSSARLPVQIAILSLSGQTVAVGCRTVDHMSTRAGASLSLRTWCAPAGPRGKKAMSCSLRWRHPASGQSHRDTGPLMPQLGGVHVVIIAHTSSGELQNG